MDKDFERVIFSYLDSQEFIQIEKDDNSIYFVNSEDGKFVQIRFHKSDGMCFVNLGLTKEISSYFSIKHFDSKEVIGRWVENTLQMRVKHTWV